MKQCLFDVRNPISSAIHDNLKLISDLLVLGNGISFVYIE